MEQVKVNRQTLKDVNTHLPIRTTASPGCWFCRGCPSIYNNNMDLWTPTGPLCSSCLDNLKHFSVWLQQFKGKFIVTNLFAP